MELFLSCLLHTGNNDCKRKIECCEIKLFLNLSLTVIYAYGTIFSILCTIGGKSL